MVGPMLIVRIFRSKLRKREDHAAASPPGPADVVLHTTTTTATTTTTPSVATEETPPPEGFTPQFLGLWQYPPPQYSLYPNDKETLVQPVTADRPKFARGIRKNLSGRWKRLTKKKNVDTEVYTIPADLRDQLKSIYVY